MRNETTKQRTSLLIISEDSPESYSPAGERVRHLALASALYFDSVMILTLDKSKKEERRSGVKSKISLCSVNFSRALPFPLSALFDPVKSLVFVVHGLRLGRSLKATSIVGSMPSLEVGASAWLLSRLLHAELNLDLRDDWESSLSVQLKGYIPGSLVGIVSEVAKLVYSHSRLLLVATQTIANTTRDRGTRTKALLVPNGADTSIFKPRNIGERNKIRLGNSLPLDKIIVVYCGSGINPYYRLDLVLKSIGLLPKNAADNLFFVFFAYNGQGGLEKLRCQLKIPDERVQIRNPMPRDQLALVLSACDIGLVPFDLQQYLLCAKSTKMYEYLSSGLYVVSSGPKGGELDLFFEANPNLGSFTLPTADNFIDVLLRVVEETELLEDNSRKSRHRFIKKYFDRQIVMTQAARALQSKPAVSDS